MSGFQLHLPLLLITLATGVGFLTVSYGIYYIRKYGRTQQVTTFTILATAITIWTGFAMLQLTATSYSLSLWAYKLLHFGSFTTSPVLFFYALSMGPARRWVNWKTASVVILLLLPAFGWLFTDPVPMLLRDPQLVSFGAFSVIDHGNSPLYTAYLSAFYILATFGLSYIVYRWYTEESVSSIQSVILVPAIFAPMLLSVAQTFQLLPFETPGTILTPTSFSLGMTGIGYAAFRYQIFDTKSLARSRTIANMNEGYLLANTDGEIIDANQSAKRLLEPWTPLVGAHITTLFPAVDDQPLVDGDTTKSFETTVDAKQNSRTCEVTVSNFVNNGQTLGTLLVVRDITTRKERERELEARERKYRSLFDGARDALMIFDRDGYLDCNDQTLDLFGTESVEDFVGHTPWELSPPTQPDGRDSEEAALEHIETAFSEGEAFFEWTHQRVDGTDFPAEVKLSRFEHDGEPALHGLVRDITERKEYEKRLETQRDNLDVLNQVLRHDIRNDLQLVTAYGELLEERCDDGEAVEYAGTVLESAEHAVDLTKSAREMADVMLSAEQDLQQVELQPIVESEIEEVQATYPTAVITAKTAIPDVTVQANDMLGSVFRNLLKNAVQHNETDVPKVTVSATESEQTVRVRVADNGPGIPEDKRAAIFGKEEKGLDSKGTGLGLYLVQTLVDSYEGTVWVEESEMDGAAFVVEVPRA